MHVVETHFEGRASIVIKKVIILVLVTLLALETTYVNSADQFSNLDLRGIASMLFLTIALQSVIVLLARKRVWLQNVLLGSCVAANVYSNNLAFNESLINSDWWVMALMIAAIVFAVFTFLGFLQDHSRWSWPIITALALLAIFYVPLQTRANLQVAVAVDSEAQVGDETSAANIRVLDFEELPNLYFIAFDSLQPEVLTQKYMDLAAAPYHAPLSKFRRFENFFAERVPSRPALNRLVALDAEHFRSKEEKNEHLGFFQGHTPSPLFEILNRNGYRTNTLYNSHYFGKEKGPHLDRYLINNSDLGICEFIDVDLKPVVFFGYCTWGLALLGSREPASVEEFFEIDQMGFLISKMQAMLSTGTPNFFAAYIYSPGHVESDFSYDRPADLEEYKDFYLNSSLQTEEWLNDLIDFIDTQDPTALLYVMGDHGPWLSRGVEFEDNPEFFVQDRYGVFGGVYPADRCSESFSALYSQDYVTVSNVSHMILRCLSGGREASRTQTAREPIYSTPSAKLIGSFENFTYE